MWKSLPACEKVKCACGEEYTQHKMTDYKVCAEDTCALVDNGYRVRVEDSDSAMIHSILQCPACLGVDLEYWGEKEQILAAFSLGHKLWRIVA